MLLRSAHRYVAEALDLEGRRLGELSLTPDFSPAGEWSHLEGVRCGALDATAHHRSGVVEPVFDQTTGPPYVTGFRVRFDAADPTYNGPEIPWNYFQQCVEGSSAQMVNNGTLRAGEQFVYRVCAILVDRNQQARSPGSDIVIDDTPVTLALESVSLDRCLAGASRLGRSAWSNRDFPVFVPSSVLDEATEMVDAAGERETGGILIGYLRRDSESPELLAEITAQIPATHADAGHSHLTFTADTWSAVSDALALRGRNEILLGWWHSHPNFCRHCAAVMREQCALARPFFSRDDCELHRTVFDTAFSVALLISDVGEENLRYDWFGWRDGSIVTRGCHLFPGDEESIYAHRDECTTLRARVLNLQEKHHEY